MIEHKSRHIPFRRSLFVVMVYLFAGLLWIKFSDDLAARWFPDPAALSHAQTWKGFVFVVVTGLVLFFTLLRQFLKDRELLQLQSHQQKRIRELNQFRESVIENAYVWISVLDSRGHVVLWNRLAETVSGYSREEVLGSDDVWEKLYPDAAYRKDVLSRARDIVADGQELDGYETEIVTRNGERRLMSWMTRIFGEADGPSGAIVIGQDITDIRLAKRRLEESERQLTNLMNNLPGMAYRCLYNANWTMKFVSSGCRELTGYEPEAMIDDQKVSYGELVVEEDKDAVTHAVETAIGNAEPFSIEYRVIRKDGRQIWVWERGTAVDEANGLVLEGIILDVSERKALEEELSEMATRDALTGLYNRREASRLLDEEVARAKRYNRSLALLWIDLDHFKSINDKHGHAAGDTVLQCVSEVLLDSVRGVDVVGRFGGEEFVVILPEMGKQDAADIAERLRLRVADTLCPAGPGVSVPVSISAGVSVYPEHGATAAELLSVADQAMYDAKHAGRNRVAIGSGVSESL